MFGYSGEVRRKSLSKRTRFRVLERDKFTCQYCGQKPPGVVLHVDHRLAVSMGGTDDDANLVTACLECNLGKSNLISTLARPKHMELQNEDCLLLELLDSVQDQGRENWWGSEAMLLEDAAISMDDEPEPDQDREESWRDYLCPS